MNTLINQTYITPWEHSAPLYMKWQKSLFNHQLWPRKFVHTHTMALACINRLMECTDVPVLEFVFENKYSEWHLKFAKKNVNDLLILDDEQKVSEAEMFAAWVTSLELVWSQLMEFNSVEDMLVVLSNILWDSTPESLREGSQVDLDGLAVSLKNKNLTEIKLLESILASVSVNSKEKVNK